MFPLPEITVLFAVVTFTYLQGPGQSYGICAPLEVYLLSSTALGVPSLYLGESRFAFRKS